MLRNTAIAEALVNASAKAINEKGIKQAPWMARTVVDRVTHTQKGTVREDDVRVHASFRTRRHIATVYKVQV